MKFSDKGVPGLTKDEMVAYALGNADQEVTDRAQYKLNYDTFAAAYAPPRPAYHQG